ncbi:hypothetical protein C6P45_000600 [Maudiozyma exigua]|uniref:Uncharacterized protein n=1 Tax=Maudiozyma exigua TaxID=34358 RepID=A0A9P6WFT2_MAUEX|nr:hypothetical protein C6P45_000600 [Kazachstania exigua]
MSSKLTKKSNVKFPTITTIQQYGNSIKECRKVNINEVNIIEKNYEKDMPQENGGQIEKLEDAITDELYYGNTLVLKDRKETKNVNPALWKPMEFGSKCKDSYMFPEILFWNLPIIFYGFGSDILHFNLYYQFTEILMSNPIGPLITSFQFFDYISQPVIFWVKPPPMDRICHSYFDFLIRRFSNREPDKGNYNTFFLKAGRYTNNWRYDMLDYKIMNVFVTNDLFEELRVSYLKSIGREFLDGEEGIETYYLKPKK